MTRGLLVTGLALEVEVVEALAVGLTRVLAVVERLAVGVKVMKRSALEVEAVMLAVLEVLRWGQGSLGEWQGQVSRLPGVGTGDC